MKTFLGIDLSTPLPPSEYMRRVRAEYLLSECLDNALLLGRQ